MKRFPLVCRPPLRFVSRVEDDSSNMWTRPTDVLHHINASGFWISGFQQTCLTKSFLYLLRKWIFSYLLLSLCVFFFPAGLWRKTKRKARSFKRRSARRPPTPVTFCLPTLPVQDTRVWHWHPPPPPPPSLCSLAPSLSPLLCLPAQRCSCSPPVEGGILRR